MHQHYTLSFEDLAQERGLSVNVVFLSVEDSDCSECTFSTDYEQAS